MTTRLAHSRAGVETLDQKPQNDVSLPSNLTQFVLLPSIARKQYKTLLSNQRSIEEASEESIFNKYIEGSDKKLGIITTGIAYNYLMENFQDTILQGEKAWQTKLLEST